MQVLIEKEKKKIASVWRELPLTVAFELQGLDVANQWNRLGLVGHAQELLIPMR